MCLLSNAESTYFLHFTSSMTRNFTVMLRFNSDIQIAHQIILNVSPKPMSLRFIFLLYLSEPPFLASVTPIPCMHAWVYWDLMVHGNVLWRLHTPSQGQRAWACTVQRFSITLFIRISNVCGVIPDRVVLNTNLMLSEHWQARLYHGQRHMKWANRQTWRKTMKITHSG